MKLFLLLFFISFSCFGQNTRWIDIEWEEVSGAFQYEVELFEGEGQNLTARGKFKVDSASWSNAVPPGRYSLRIRSLDRRGVPGEWSEYIPVKVRMHNPQLLVPGTLSKIATPNVNFEWTEEEGAALYQLVVKGEKDKIVFNGSVKSVRSSVYLEDLGEYSWTVYALEEGEPLRTEEEFTTSSFRKFIRVGGELDSPIVKVSVAEKVLIEWKKVRNATHYEIDYQPPVNLDKNRRFKVEATRFAFPAVRLKEGTTTITVKSTTAGYPDSEATIIQLLKNGNKVEVEDIIQPDELESSGPHPSAFYWKNEVLISVGLSRYSYESRNSDTSTDVDQKELTGAGLNLEWLNKPKLNSLHRRLDFSFSQLSSGKESGTKLRTTFTINKEKALSSGRLFYGGGVNFLRLPAFFGDRLENDVFVRYSTSAGPAIWVSYIRPLAGPMAFQISGSYSQQLIYLSSDLDNGKSFGWMNLDLRGLYYMSKKEALFLSLTGETWNQKWGSDKSSLTGYGILLGFRAGY